MTLDLPASPTSDYANGTIVLDALGALEHIHHGDEQAATTCLGDDAHAALIGSLWLNSLLLDLLAEARGTSSEEVSASIRADLTSTLARPGKTLVDGAALPVGQTDLIQNREWRP